MQLALWGTGFRGTALCLRRKRQHKLAPLQPGTKARESSRSAASTAVQAWGAPAPNPAPGSSQVRAVTVHWTLVLKHPPQATEKCVHLFSRCCAKEYAILHSPPGHRVCGAGGCPVKHGPPRPASGSPTAAAAVSGRAFNYWEVRKLFEERALLHPWQVFPWRPVNFIAPVHSTVP